MSFKRTVLTGLGIAGGLAGFNVWQASAAGPLASELPGTTGYWRSPYGKVFHKTLGQGEPVVLLHGFNAGASSYEMRRQTVPLAERFQVFAPDWLGFGLSERPNLTYTGQLYCELLDGFMREVVRRPAHIIASSLAGAYVIRNAAQTPDLYRRLVLVAPTGIESLASRPSGAQGALRSVVASPLVGEAVFNLLVTGPSLRYFLEQQGYYDPTQVTDAVIGAYLATTHQPGARYAPASFVSGFLNLPIRRDWLGLKQPALLVWGREATSTPVEDANAFLALKPDARLEVFDRARLLPHDEHAERFNQLVVRFLSEGITTD